MKKKNVRTEHSSVLIACLFIFAVLFVCLPPQAKGQYHTPDSCLKMIWPDDYNPLTNEGTINPDSVKVDTCQNSPTYGMKYAQKYFLIQLKPYYYPFDTLLKPNEFKYVSEISNHCSQLKQKFEQLENNYGQILFHGLFEEVSDSSLLKNPLILISLNQYENCDSIVNILKSIDSISYASYQMRAYNYTIVPDNSVNGELIILYPNPVFEYLFIKSDNHFNQDEIKIYSEIGQEVLLKTIINDVVDVTVLNSGAYYFRYKNKLYKFIKIK